MSERESLAVYLAKYIDTEVNRLSKRHTRIVHPNIDCMKGWIEQGIEAYESIHNVLVNVVG